jgi:hypothetical protein
MAMDRYLYLWQIASNGNEYVGGSQYKPFPKVCVLSAVSAGQCLQAVPSRPGLYQKPQLHPCDTGLLCPSFLTREERGVGRVLVNCGLDRHHLCLSCAD